MHGDAEHQRAPASFLGHFAGGVGVPFHEGNDPGGGEGAVLYLAVLRADM